MKLFKSRGRLYAGLIIVGLLLLFTIITPLLSPYTPFASDFSAMRAAPSYRHWLGTDQLGRDHLTRLAYGGRISLLTATAAGGISLLIGMAAGALAALKGGVVDRLLMRGAELITALPLLPVAITITAMMAFSGGPAARVIVLVMLIGGMSWGGTARILRGVCLHLKNEEYMLAARGMGLALPVQIKNYLMPALFPQISINAALLFSRALMSESALSFLGVGVSELTPTWGALFASARNFDVLYGQSYLWISTAVVLTLTALGANLIADGMAGGEL
jgi:peptide/nickel transport system permease protein